ncbi:MAG: glycosyltransferase family 2 protein [Candidatus Zixiibacteriota bacterium]|nr:MAG: glycosyltransferase family 2 protein [candidate division Zixibacteria bacterium]
MPETAYRPSVSVFLPAYNEEENIERAVKNSVAVLREITDDWEVIVVNDASRDRTGEIAEQLCREIPGVRVVHHEKNTRLGGALRTGFSNATKQLVFYTDADNPIDMNDLKRAVPLMADADFVTGYRLNREEPLKRKVYSRCYNWLIRLLFGLKVRDVNFSFKLVKREVLQKARLRSMGSFIDAELLIEARKYGFRIREMGVKYYPRTLGESTLATPGVILKILDELWVYYRKHYRNHVSDA